MKNTEIIMHDTKIIISATVGTKLATNTVIIEEGKEGEPVGVSLGSGVVSLGSGVVSLGSGVVVLVLVVIVEI